MMAAVTVIMGLELQSWRSDTFFIPLLLLLACAGIAALRLFGIYVVPKP
ncbi:hypothetical protein [Herpetosiphon sp. NSE202]